jgi:hypothetical protein
MHVEEEEEAERQNREELILSACKQIVEVILVSEGVEEISRL